MNTPRHGLPFLALGAALLAASACASRPPHVRVLPPVSAPGVENPVREGTVVPPLSAGSAAGSAIVRTAEALVGTPYREGGALPDGFDCSGLVNYVFARNGIAVPRDVRRQAVAGVEVPRGAILAGDLVFFSTTGSGPTHVGIALGGGRFIHAPKSGTAVRVESLASGYWTARLVAARRVVPGSALEFPR
jgi:cell wall-associated NlpC family hydrolase